jgi:GNAT superfamily N-acetyltransferase
MYDLPISPHPYQTGDELARILHAVGEWNAQTDGCGYLHPGDVRHFISNGCRGRSPSDHLFYLEDRDLDEDGSGAILAVIMISPPKRASFDLMIHPAYRGGALEAALIPWAEARVWESMQAEGIERDWVKSETMPCDPVRQSLLQAQGYEGNEPSMRYTTRSLSEPIPESVLPEGFIIRPAAGLHESEQLGEVHSSAFKSNWQPGEYLKVMQSPGYEIDHELIVVAPDGRFAAFLIYWIDPVSKVGLFEPVGCHQDFRRRGLTKALMYEGMRRMVAHGMTTGAVVHELEDENPASGPLYVSVGFTPKYEIVDSRKTMK